MSRVIQVDKLRNRAETEKIAALLGEDPGRLAFLDGLPADDVRTLREQAVAALFDGTPDMLDRIARATKLVPAGVAAAISQKALGPRLAAAVAGKLEPARAADIIEKLPVSFTAESCAHLDPRRIEAIVDRLDENLLVRISVALAGRGDHLTMGRFVGHLRDSALTRILPQVDDAVVLRTGFAIDRPQRLGRIIELMGRRSGSPGSSPRLPTDCGPRRSPSPRWCPGSSAAPSPRSPPASRGTGSTRWCGRWPRRACGSRCSRWWRCSARRTAGRSPCSPH